LRKAANIVLQRIGHAKDVSTGSLRAFDVLDLRVTMANADGHLYAFEDTCTHTGCSLARGTLAGTTVTCGCHGSQFDVTSGAVVRGPASRPVRSWPVQVVGEDILIDAGT
jgi:3-phenylpropionate/trans-cinnamate dioxygenase ferredoxin component